MLSFISPANQAAAAATSTFNLLDPQTVEEKANIGFRNRQQKPCLVLSVLVWTCVTELRPFVVLDTCKKNERFGMR